MLYFDHMWMLYLVENAHFRQRILQKALLMNLHFVESFESKQLATVLASALPDKCDLTVCARTNDGHRLEVFYCDINLSCIYRRLLRAGCSVLIFYIRLLSDFCAMLFFNNYFSFRRFFHNELGSLFAFFFSWVGGLLFLADHGVRLLRALHGQYG